MVRLGWLVLLYSVLWMAPAISSGADPPNFLFIYTDDQRWDALGVVQREQGEHGRFPWLESPNLDRMATEGIRFRNAFVVTALCSPSRAAFLTGRYGHHNGVVNNRTPFPIDNVTHASVLRANGYRTGYIGKWHMDGQRGQRPGFDYSASFIGQGVYFNCPFEINGERTTTEGWVDDVSTDYAIAFMKENKDRPFSLVLGYKTCHGPFTPPPRTAETYGDAEARIVPNLRVEAIYRQAELARQAKQADGKKQNKKKAALQESLAGNENSVKTNLGMFRGLRAIDENVGRLLAALDELGVAEDTVVVYTSDNGYYLGEHGLGDKRSAYEESIRIPFLMRYPRLGIRGRVVDEMVLNIDVAPTWLDFAGLKLPTEMEGRTLRPLLDQDRSDLQWRTSFFYSYFREGKFPVPTVTAVRTETAKLIKYRGHDEWTEVFDLKSDPYETRNLAGNSQHADLQKSLDAEYDRQSKAVGYHVPDFADGDPGM